MLDVSFLAAEQRDLARLALAHVPAERQRAALLRALPEQPPDDGDEVIADLLELLA